MIKTPKQKAIEELTDPDTGLLDLGKYDHERLDGVLDKFSKEVVEEETLKVIKELDRIIKGCKEFRGKYKL